MGCLKKLIQNYALDLRKNEVNGSKHEIDQGSRMAKKRMSPNTKVPTLYDRNTKEIPA